MATQVPHAVVVGQVESKEKVNGVYVDGVTVTAQLDSGTQFSVFVPRGQYTPTTVKNMIEQAALKYAAVDTIEVGGNV